MQIIDRIKSVERAISEWKRKRMKDQQRFTQNEIKKEKQNEIKRLNYTNT